MPIKRKIIPYNPELKDLAKELRRNMTLSEVLLWNELKQKRILGFDFDRQRPINNFIVDFYCKQLSLAIEIDGDTHIYRYEYDDERQKRLEELGIHFLRFEDIEVKKNMNNVLRVIEDWIGKNQPTPSPSKEGNYIDNELIERNRHTTDYSREGNYIENDLTKNNKPTPNPSQEGNFTDNKLIGHNQHTSDHSREGNYIENDLTKNNKPTPNPSQEGNYTDNKLIGHNQHTSGPPIKRGKLSQEGNQL